jgi:hypothetical protein
MEHGLDPSIRVWESNGYRVPYVPYNYRHVFALEAKHWDPRKAHRFIVDNWHFSIPIVIAYVFVSC